MKKVFVILWVGLVCASLAAQVRTGTIWGHVTDTQGAPLPGVSVSLKSTYSAVITVLTDAEGVYRFFSLAPSKEYTVTAELQGFKKVEKTGVIVVIGQQSRIDLTMEQGKLEEEVTVVAVTPMVDAKKATVGKSVTQEIMQSLPSSRDPWEILGMVPALELDRANVGGSESGTQPFYWARGDASWGSNNVWALDGVVVTDPAAAGATPIYWDFDAFEEMNVVTGGADVTIQTGGIALNMVTRRGGNKVSMGGRFYLTDSYFQANNMTQALINEGLTGVNKINYIKDYGFNIGGPVWKDRIWLWGSYGVQDISTVNIIGVPQKPLITNYNFKLNVQPIPSNRFEALLTVGNKTMSGRGSAAWFPEGWDQSALYHFGQPVIKLQDEQTIGNNLLLATKFAFMDSGFQFLAGSDPGRDHLVRYDATAGVQYDNWWYLTKRPMYDYDFHTQYYNDKLLGLSHEIKLGVEYSTRRVTTDSSYPGQLYDMYDLYWGSLDPTGSGNPQVIPGMNEFNLYHGTRLDWSIDQLVAFFQDTITARRFNFLLGLRFDRQTPKINSSLYPTVDNNPVWAQYFDPAVSQALGAFMPGTLIPTIKPNYHWNVWSPRLGITYDLFGNGKTLLKLSGSMYGDFMGTVMASYWNPMGTYGQMNFYWLDGALDGSSPKDGKVQANELYTYDPTTFAPIPLLVSNGSGGYTVNPAYTSLQQFINWWGFTPYSSASTPSPYTVDPKATSMHTWELLATLEHELLPDFGISLQATYRRYTHLSFDVPYYANGPYGDYSINGQNVVLGPSDYSPVGTVPSSITYTDSTGTHTVDLGTGAGRTFYLLQAPFQGAPYTYHMLDTNYGTYWGIDLTFNKRLSHKWMLDGSVSYMDERQHYGNGYTNPTPLWALQNGIETNPGPPEWSTGSLPFSHWMVKLEGLYQLPLGFNVSFTFNARAGYIIPHYMTVVDYAYAAINPSSTSVTTWLDVLGTTKLPTFYVLNLRLEKEIKLFNTGRVYLMADAFNVTNAAIINRRYDRNEGTYFINSDGTTRFQPNPLNYAIYTILNPFVARFGVRFQF